MNHFSKLTLLSLSVALTACTTLTTEKIDYKSSGKGPTLEIPPDLTQLSRDSRYTVLNGAVTASSFQTTQPTQNAPIASAALGDVRLERSGTQRWLVINRPADKLWEPVRDFWQENGFILTMDQSNLGIMETDWAENRAKIPGDVIRNTLGKLVDSLYSTGERDKFRTRLERNAAGGTDVFISHRGMVEVFDSTQKDRTVWQPRAADPELEAEFLSRLMIKLGASPNQIKEVLATPPVKVGSRVTEVAGQSAVQIDDGFDRAWRRVGLSLDRTGFTVEDRDRSKGVYFVRYVEPSVGKSEPGFLGKLFSFSKPETTPVKFRVSVVSQDTLTLVSVQNASGQPDRSDSAQRILKVIAEDLK